LELCDLFSICGQGCSLWSVKRSGPTARIKITERNGADIMPFDIQNLNPGEWFEYPGETDPPERVKIRLPEQSVIKQIDAETIKKEVEHIQPRKKNGKIDRRQGLQRIEYEVIIDEQKREELLIDHIITDWEIKTPDGKDIPCTKENKTKMMFGSVEFNNFVNECLEILSGEKEQRNKDLEKNLSSGAGGLVKE